jgi:hypothetical protein
MGHTLYIPAYTADIARQKARLFESREPFYWRAPQAAHEAADWHYPDGKVFAVTRHADGTVTVREHILAGPEHAIDPRPLTVGNLVLAFSAIAIAIGGVWLVGQGSLL